MMSIFSSISEMEVGRSVKERDASGQIMYHFISSLFTCVKRDTKRKISSIIKHFGEPLWEPFSASKTGNLGNESGIRLWGSVLKWQYSLAKGVNKRIACQVGFFVIKKLGFFSHCGSENYAAINTAVAWPGEVTQSLLQQSHLSQTDT